MKIQIEDLSCAEGFDWEEVYMSPTIKLHDQRSEWIRVHQDCQHQSASSANHREHIQ